MARLKRTLMVVGVSAAAGLTGYTLGLVFAPASGKETRRRWTRAAEDEWRAVAGSCERMLERAVTLAKREIDTRKKQLSEAMAHKGC